VSFSSLSWLWEGAAAGGNDSVCGLPQTFCRIPASLPICMAKIA
jgi:hypothetical protein